MITSSGAKKELERRRRKAAQASTVVLDELFPEQNAFVNDPSRYIAACCTRRAGKSSALALKFLRTMEKYPRAQSLYLSLTQESAKQIMWGVLQDMDAKYKLGLSFVESSLTVAHPNGHKLRLMGADLTNFIRRLRGRKFAGVAIDEAQEFGVHIQALIDDVLTPSIADYTDGWLALTGTPGCVPAGVFFDITQAGKYGYSTHKWSLLSNPWMPNPAAFIEDLKQRRGWDDTNPTLRREWRGEWVLDVESLWVRYKEDINNYDYVPEIPLPSKYSYILGIDIGFNDADALAVLAWSPTSKTVYLVEEKITKKQGLTELVDQIKALSDKYKFTNMVIDEGGLGKKLAEEIRRRHAIPVHGADKTRKQETVELLNDALRLGTFKAKSNSRFAQDSYLIQIDWDKSTPDKVVIKKKPHSDIIDAVLYAFKISPAYTYQKQPDLPKPGTPEWGRKAQEDMFEAAIGYFGEQAELNRKISG